MTVDLWVSPGPLHVAVPALRGPTSAQARRSLADAGLLGDSRKTRSATFAAGHVAHQEPKAGGRLTRGQTAKYWVSAGLPLVEVPDVVGLSSGDGGAAGPEARRPASRSRRPRPVLVAVPARAGGGSATARERASAGPATTVAGTREQLATLTLDAAAASIEASRARDARSLRPSGGR